MSLKSNLPNLQENVSLANHTTFRIGGAARYFCVAKDRDEFLAAARAAKEKNISLFVLGGGSNLLVADEGFGGLVIKNQISKTKYRKENGMLKIFCDTGVPLTKIILETTRQGYSGAEWGFGIPGTIGGAIYGNAGRLGQAIAQVVESVRAMDKNLNEKEISATECEFGYRGSRFKKTGEIILNATLVFGKKDKSLIEQVLNKAKEVIKHSPPFPSAGCIFKNYTVRTEGVPPSEVFRSRPPTPTLPFGRRPSLKTSLGGATENTDPLLKNHPELVGRVRGGHAERGQSPDQLGGKIGVGYLIDQCGLKGKKSGGAQIWEGHANYIVNTGGAKAKDVLALIELCKETVKEKFAINIEEEVRFLG
ncbi:UDP-N-acetylmuramate dehydrogenase [Patescibacteria group bacterium]|nr:UDP-N-acetylmuramate dehydrogenase [Patescibacteria group bacterium]